MAGLLGGEKYYYQLGGHLQAMHPQCPGHSVTQRGQGHGNRAVAPPSGSSDRDQSKETQLGWAWGRDSGVRARCPETALSPGSLRSVPCPLGCGTAGTKGSQHGESWVSADRLQLSCEAVSGEPVSPGPRSWVLLEGRPWVDAVGAGKSGWTTGGAGLACVVGASPLLPPVKWGQSQDKPGPSALRPSVPWLPEGICMSSRGWC